MPQPHVVLVTGSAGNVGRAVCAELQARGHRVRGLDVRATSGISDCFTGSMADMALVQKAVAGCDTVIHLAATPSEADFMTKLLPNNIIAVYNLLEACREHGVKRLILTSTVQTVFGHQGPWPLTPQMLPSPRNWYASAKLFAEHAGEAYAHKYGISVIAVRLGWCPHDHKTAEHMRQREFDMDHYISRQDVGRFFACAVEVEKQIQFAVLFATSKPVFTPRYDIESARELIGYVPQHKFPEGTEELPGAPQRTGSA